MCNFKIINSNSFGCVVVCSGCDHLHLGFGNLLVAYNAKEFSRFVNKVQNTYDNNYAEMLLSGDKIYFKTECENMVIAFNTDELKSLYELLTEAALMLQVNYLLYENNKN